jgi:outer membrane protein assembly factor BamB
MRRSVSSIICMLLLCGSAAAIYQDQAGKYDWLKQHVGVIKHVEVSGAAQPCIYVASTAGVLAALSPEDGSLLWRKVLDEDATIDALAAGSGVLVALSSQRHVRAFGGGGRLLWEASLPPARGAAASRADIAIVPGGKGSTMVAVRDGRAVAFALKSGRQVWAADLGLTDQEAAAVQRTAGPGEVLVAFLQHG